MKYRLKESDGRPRDGSIEDTWRRVADALAEAEPTDARPKWRETFYRALENYRFLPAGRILAGAGAGRNVTLFNCFVMGRIDDSMTGIFAALREAALTMQQGGGIGHDFSTLRPKGAAVLGVGADASGPLSFMDVWDAMCRTIMSAGSRRGAMMGTMRCDHPDIELFIDAKRDAARLRMFNLSVLVTDAFMKAVKGDADWPLVFAGKVYRTVRARALWDRILRATYDVAEPGVIFIDRINAANNLSYCETIEATNPCGEQPLPPYGACLLGSVNLTRFIDPSLCVRRCARSRGAEKRRRRGGAHDGRCHRRFALPASRAGTRGARQAPHRPWNDGPRRCPGDVRPALRNGRGRRAGDRVDGGNRARGLRSEHRDGAREGSLPAVRSRSLSRFGPCPRPSRADPEADPQARHPQRAPDLDRSDRHHLARRRQRVERHRAHLRARTTFAACCAPTAATARSPSRTTP